MIKLLPDSNLFIRWSRQRQNPALILAPYLEEGVVMTCGVVRAEVLRGAKDPKVKDKLLTLFSVMNEIATTFQVWERVASLAWTMDRQRKQIPLTDTIIAACALEAGAAVVSPDTHFLKVPGLTVYPALP